MSAFFSLVNLYWRGGVGGGSWPPKPWERFARRLGSIMRTTVGTALCMFGFHEHVWGCSVYGPDSEPEALRVVRWLCGRCNLYIGWGYYADGPRGGGIPRPSVAQLYEWGQKRRAEYDADRAQQRLEKTAKLATLPTIPTGIMCNSCKVEKMVAVRKDGDGGTLECVCGQSVTLSKSGYSFAVATLYGAKQPVREVAEGRRADFRWFVEAERFFGLDVMPKSYAATQDKWEAEAAFAIKHGCWP